MLDFLSRVASSQHPWSAAIYLVLGTILGAISSLYLTFKIQRPRLIVGGGGGGGSAERQQWCITIANKPRFLGLSFAGEPARDLSAYIKLREKGANSYPLFWRGKSPDWRATIEPGHVASLDFFTWIVGQPGYAIVDAAGEPVARFTAPAVEFMLVMTDRLSRTTKMRFSVSFDDSRLNNAPQLKFHFGQTIESRIEFFGAGLRMLGRAFLPRN